MLTVLHTESSEGWGGQENRTIEECVGLKRRGARPIVLARPGSRIKARAAALGIEVRTHALRGTYDLSAVLYVLKVVREDSVDVINTHSGVDSFVSSVAGRLSGRRPAIVRTRHLALPITSKGSYSILPHRVVTVSEYVRRHLGGDKKISPDKVVTVPTGIDIRRFDPESAPDVLRAELGLKGGSPLIAGTVAILRRKKGHHVLLEAIPSVLRECPDTLFVFAGDGPQRENIERRIRELGIGDNVRLLGMRTDVPSVLMGFDLFVLPTLQEALGTSILEASAMKKAVIATRAGGGPEVVRANVTGLLVDPEDPGGLAAAIIRLLKDKGLRSSMGEEGRRLVEREYTVEGMVERMLLLYEE